MKKLYLFAALAAMLAACSENDLTKESPQTVDEGAVTFEAYMQRATTRAGLADVMNLTNLQKSQEDGGGFGVFGYYTNSATYDQQAVPNFFYNEKVTWNGEFFEYNPIKYWPNEFGTSAESEDQDKVSFFAYAPYVEVSPSTGKVIKWDASDPDKIDQEASAKLQKWGITTLSNNSATGDPLVKYIVSFDQDKSVDLCWGVCDDINWPIVMNGSSQQINNAEKGLPWLDVQRPADPTKLSATTGQKVKFTFKHATAQLKVNINAFVDGTDNTNPIAEKTKVFVRSITFEGFATKGALNLNNTEAGANKAYWMDWTGSNDIVTGEAVTIYDGRKDGKEGTPSGIATNEKSLGLNPALIQTDKATVGVTKDLQPLFCKGEGAATAPIYVIPTGDDVRVTITYDIETEDDKLSTYISDATTHGSSIENVITKVVDFGTTKTFENGKSYVINLHLGMNSVKFDATVTDWVETSDADVDLPKNVPVFAATSGDGTTKTVELPANVTEYSFAVSGLNGGEVVTVTPDGTVVKEPTSPAGSGSAINIAANSSGVALIKATISENTTVNKNTDGQIVVSDASGHKATIKFTQAPAPLNLIVKSVDFGNKAIELKADPSDWNDSPTITVLKNGVKLTTKDSPTNNKEVGWNGTNKEITFFDAFQAGDTYTITVKAGDAEEETVIYKVKAGSLSFARPSITAASGGSAEENELTQDGDGTVAYTSSNESVATVVNPSNGTVSVVGPGITTIKATVDQATATYLYANNTATYTLVVTGEFAAATGTGATGTVNVGLEGGTGYFFVTNANNYSKPIVSVDAIGKDWVECEIVDDTKLASNGQLKIKYTVKEKTVVRDNAIITVTSNHATDPKSVKITVAQPSIP